MNSEIILCKNIKLDKNYVNVLNYTEEQMLNLCRNENNIVAIAYDYSFIRPQNSIFVGFTYEQCLQANYIAFQNKDYSNKWFFAFIDEVIYKSNKNTEIRFTVDIWSTWFSNWSTSPCFVEREHVNDDSIGANTIPENLDIGEIIEESEQYDSSYSNQFGYYVIISSNWKIKDNSTGTEVLESDKGSQHNGISVYNNNVSGTELFAFKIVNSDSFINIIRFIERTNSDGHIEDIENMYIAPLAVIDEFNLISHSAYAYQNAQEKIFTWFTLPYTFEIEKFNTEINKRITFNDFVPKNRKMFCISI